MPQAPEEQRARWLEPDGSLGEQRPVKFLQDHGYTLTPEHMWVKPSPSHMITFEERDAISYMINEWDYGSVVPPTLAEIANLPPGPTQWKQQIRKRITELLDEWLAHPADSFIKLNYHTNVDLAANVCGAWINNRLTEGQRKRNINHTTPYMMHGSDRRKSTKQETDRYVSHGNDRRNR